MPLKGGCYIGTFADLSLDVARLYLFGNVKFLDLLILLMVFDIVTGIAKAIKNKSVRSRVSLYGFAQKIGIFVVIVVANMIDIVLDLKGMVASATVLFYIANECLSVVENLAASGVKIPPVIREKLLGFAKSDDDRDSGEDKPNKKNEKDL